MKYDIYFHNDFDGIASAATLLNFLRNRGDGFLNYHPIDYPVESGWFGRKFKKPTAVVDFQFHLDAKIWFDHHSTAFQKKSWQEKFRNEGLKQWNRNYKSCCHLILDSLINNFGFKSPKFLNELTYWADKIDGALFSSAKEALDLNLTVNSFDLLLDCLAPEFETKKGVLFLKKVIMALSQKPFKEAVRPFLATSHFKRCKMRFYKSMNFYKKNLVRYGNTAFIDTTLKTDIIPLHLASFYYYPKSLFVIRLLKKDRGFGLGASSNPWHRPTKKIQIGKFLEKNFGGGGHQYVGGANFKTKEKAMKVVPKILKFLNRYK